MGSFNYKPHNIGLYQYKKLKPKTVKWEKLRIKENI